MDIDEFVEHQPILGMVAHCSRSKARAIKRRPVKCAARSDRIDGANASDGTKAKGGCNRYDLFEVPCKA